MQHASAPAAFGRLLKLHLGSYVLDHWNRPVTQLINILGQCRMVESAS